MTLRQVNSASYSSIVWVSWPFFLIRDVLMKHNEEGARARTPSPSASLLLSAFRMFLLFSRLYELLSSRDATIINSE